MTDDTEEATFGHKFKSRRLELGLSQGKLSKMSGVSQSDISKLELGKKMLNNENMIALEDALYKKKILGSIDPEQTMVSVEIKDSSPLTLEVVDYFTSGDMLAKDSHGNHYRVSPL